jgi:regulator of RNase E activity RraA
MLGKEAELFETIRSELFTAVIGDVMDSIGLTCQFLPPQIKPLHDNMIVLGRAMTVLQEDILPDDKSTPFGLLFEALDDLKPNEVYLTTGGSPNYALWGGLMSTRAIKLQATGAVLNGYHRDTVEVRELEFPVFSLGSFAQDQNGRGKVVDFRCPLRFPNGITVNSGDIVFGDIDGVVIIPQDSETKVVELALAKVHGENVVRDSIEAGMSAKDAFDKYGIL